LTKRSKKEKAEGREQHRQALRAKKMQKKEKKKVTVPAKYRKKVEFLNFALPTKVMSTEIFASNNPLQIHGHVLILCF